MCFVKWLMVGEMGTLRWSGAKGGEGGMELTAFILSR